MEGNHDAENVMNFSLYCVADFRSVLTCSGRKTYSQTLLVWYFHWQGFARLVAAMRADTTDSEKPEAFKHEAREWGKLFVEVTFEEDVTPYIHSE